MCGIFWAKLLVQDLDIYRKGFDLIEHRGPDNTFFDVQETQVIAFHHLSIVSAMPGRSFVQGPWSVVCNGEIYSAENDCEHMISACDLQDKSSFLRNINGDFACIWASADKVCAARDPVGVCPLFVAFSKNNKVIGLASEGKSLVGLPFVDSVQRFPPGHWWDSSLNSFLPYTDIYTGIHTPDFTLKDRITSAVQRRLKHGDAPAALLCSGGIDSSIIAYLARQILPTEKIHAFSVEFASDNGRSEDTIFASMLLKGLAIQHTLVKFTEEDIQRETADIVRLCETADPITVRAAIPMFFLAKHIRENFPHKVVLSGEGADEIFMGYTYFDNAPSSKHAEAESRRLIQNIHSFDLLRAERCFAAHGLEVRVPFLDTDLVRHVLALDGASRLPVRSVEKALLREAFQDAKILVDTGISRRTKMRMSDGVSFSYVASLLRLWSGTNLPGSQAITLEKMEQKERDTYEKWLTHHGWMFMKPDLVPRQMPKWDRPIKEKLLGNEDIMEAWSPFQA